LKGAKSVKWNRIAINAEKGSEARQTLKARKQRRSSVEEMGCNQEKKKEKRTKQGSVMWGDES